MGRYGVLKNASGHTDELLCVNVGDTAIYTALDELSFVRRWICSPSNMLVAPQMGAHLGNDVQGAVSSVHLLTRRLCASVQLLKRAVLTQQPSPDVHKSNGKIYKKDRLPVVPTHRDSKIDAHASSAVHTHSWPVTSHSIKGKLEEANNFLPPKHARPRSSPGPCKTQCFFSHATRGKAVMSALHARGGASQTDQFCVCDTQCKRGPVFSALLLTELDYR